MPAEMTPSDRPDAAKPRRRMSTRNRILFLATGWLIVAMPFLFWWNTWFGRQLSDPQLAEYLQDNKKPRHIQHALVQIGERMVKHDASVSRWYAELVGLAAHPVEEVRNTDAWVMGQDTSGSGFHETLLKMLQDPSPMVRGNAALSLVRFGDASGRTQILALLQPVEVAATQPGEVTDTAAVGQSIHQDGMIAKLRNDGQVVEIRSPMSGRLRSLYVQIGQRIPAGMNVAIVEPSDEQVWEALRALYLVGQIEDVAMVSPYERNVPDISDHVRQQAELTEQAIRSRAK